MEFTVENRGSVDDTFLLELSNPLGWPMALTSPALEQITLSAGEEAVIEAEMTIADDPTTHTTNLAFLTAVAQGDPTMTDTHWLSVTMAVENIAMLGIVEPTGFTTVTDSVSPKVVVQNLGHVDSFFDVFFEVELPGGGILTDGSVPVTAMIPGEAREIDLGAVVFTEGGNHTLRATVQLATDVDPLDDEDTLEFPVEVTTGVQDWRNL